MGIYLNPGAEAFQMALASKIYVDKTELMLHLNAILNTERRFICISRPRRFGKSMTANMICAYYDHTVNGNDIFGNLKIAQAVNGMSQQGKYDVIRINMQEFLTRTHNMNELIQRLAKSILWDLLGEYPNYRYFDEMDMIRIMADIYQQTKRKFVIVIDEWDCIFREYPHNFAEQTKAVS